MIRKDEDALICDFAETYHIYDYRGLPAEYAAVLACGLRENSRIRMIMAEAELPPDQYLIAGIMDRLSVLVWQNSEDGRKNRNRPELVTEKLKKGKEKNVAYDSGADFLRAWKERTGG